MESDLNACEIMGPAGSKEVYCVWERHDRHPTKMRRNWITCNSPDEYRVSECMHASWVISISLYFSTEAPCTEQWTHYLLLTVYKLFGRVLQLRVLVGMLCDCFSVTAELVVSGLSWMTLWDWRICMRKLRVIPAVFVQCSTAFPCFVAPDLINGCCTN